MNSELDRPVVFDESCAQENVAPNSLSHLPISIADRKNHATGERLERLELWMWFLCFTLGVLVGNQFLPLAQGWLQ